MTANGGKDSGGRGTSGIVDEKTREAKAGETDTTRFGFAEEGSETDRPRTGGTVDKEHLGGGTTDEAPGAKQ